MVVVDTSTSAISMAGQATICSEALAYLDPFGGFSPLPKLSPVAKQLRHCLHPHSILALWLPLLLFICGCYSKD